MPYIQLFIKGQHPAWHKQIFPSPDLREVDARKELQELREQFPLQQSGGIFYRMNHDSVLFEQPEHLSLTLEQEVWLEQHGYDTLAGINFYRDRTEGCGTCGMPFDGVPEGYIGGFRCLHAGNPYQITHVHIPCSSDECLYIQLVSLHTYGIIEEVYIRQMALTLANLIEQAHDPSMLASLLATDSFSSTIAHFMATNICIQCKQPLAQCTCLREPFPLGAAFTHAEYAHLQTLAEHYGLTLETFIRRALGIPAVQFAFMSRSAARGHVLSCDLSFYLTYLAQPYQPYVQIGKKRVPNITSFGPPNGPQIPFDTYHLTSQAVALADALPLLSDLVITILTGLHTTPPTTSHLSWCKAQLEQLDLTTYQQAKPCTMQDITELEHLCDQALPPAYTEFLSWMGHGAGAFLQYLTCFFPTLPTHQQAARTMLTQDASPATLPDDTFVFHLHPDDHFVFFRTSEGDDPPVYAHKRDWRVKPFQKIFYRFSDFLAIQLALYATYQQPESMPTTMREKGSRGRFLAMQERVRKTREHQPSQE